MLAATLAALFAATAPSIAHAQSVSVNGTPINPVIDERGGLQVDLDDAQGQEFAAAATDVGHAGLELKVGSTYSPLSDPNRQVIDAPARSNSGTTQIVTSKYSLGGVVVTQRAYVDQGQPTLRLEYDFFNPTENPIDVRAAEIGELARESVGLLE